MTSSFHKLACAFLVWLSCLCAGEAYGAERAPRVVVFAGHTSITGERGPQSASGMYENEFNDSILARVVSQRRPDLEFVGIASGRNVPLRRRAMLAQALNAAAIVEIHHDSVQPYLYQALTLAGPRDPMLARFRGFSLHVYPEGESIRLARSIEARMIAAGLDFSVYHTAKIPGENMRLANGTQAVYERPSLRLLRTSTVPTVIVECGCTANPEEEQELMTAERKTALANAIVAGVADYFRAIASLKTAPQRELRRIP